MFSLCRELRLEVLRQAGLRLSKSGEGIFAQYLFSLCHLGVALSRQLSDKKVNMISTLVLAILLRQNPIILSETSDRSKKSKKQRALVLPGVCRALKRLQLIMT